MFLLFSSNCSFVSYPLFHPHSHSEKVLQQNPVKPNRNLKTTKINNYGKSNRRSPSPPAVAVPPARTVQALRPLQILGIAVASPPRVPPRALQLDHGGGEQRRAGRRYRHHRRATAPRDRGQPQLRPR